MLNKGSKGGCSSTFYRNPEAEKPTLDLLLIKKCSL